MMLIARINTIWFVKDRVARPLLNIGPYQPVDHWAFVPSAGLHRGCMDTGAGVAHPNSQSQHKASAVNMAAN